MSELIFVQNANHAKQLSRLSRQGEVRRVCQGVYTGNLGAELRAIVLRGWMEILPHIVPAGVLSYRTAHDLKPTVFNDTNIVFVTSSYNKTIKLPGLWVKVLAGNKVDYIEQVLPNLARCNRARMLLENLSIVRSRDYKNIKIVSVAEIEKLLAKEIRLRGESGVNKLRDEAKEIAGNLGFQSEYKRLNKLISALLATHKDETILTTDIGKSISQKNPYDETRLQTLTELSIYLKQCDFVRRSYDYSKISFKNISFYESYFSNFIEGTEFVIDEAEDIVFKGVEINNRHADSHDVLAHFNLGNDYIEMHVTPKSVEHLIELLQERHALLMKERPEKNPGIFKSRSNRAGGTLFVEPEDVIGTLKRAYKLYDVLNPGMERALFLQFLITEMHPFDDGNGRLSRIMMNAELVSDEQYKVVLPSVHRDNYLNGLRLASRDNNFRTYCKTMDQAHAYTATIPWNDYPETREKIEIDGANLPSDDGLPIFNRVLRALVPSDFSLG